MNIRTILLLLLGVIVIGLNIFYGNAISGFLGVCIIGSILYYIFQMYFERNITEQVRTAGGNTSVLVRAAYKTGRYRALFNFLFFTTLFVSSIICIRNVVMPRMGHPYFMNNEYHAISNSGIEFKNALPLFTRAHQDVSGKMVLTPSGSQVTLTTQQFFTPIFVADGEDKYRLVNKIFDKRIEKGFTISNGKTTIHIDIENDQSFFGKVLGRRPSALYHVRLESSQSELFGIDNGAATITDAFTFRSPFLKEGMSLYNLLFQQTLVTEPTSEGMQVMQEIMQEIGESYLIADHHDKSDGYYFFPNKLFVDASYKLMVDGVPVTQNISASGAIPMQKFFYIGFHNAREKMQIVPSDKAGYVTLTYDHPPMYWLSAPRESQQINNKINAFLTNDFNQVIDGNNEEGFYFNNFGLQTDALFDGNIQYIIGKPTDALQYAVHDYKGKDSMMVNAHQFKLSTNKSDIQYLFQLRDFSDNAFSYNQMLWYAGIVYVAILMLLIFKPGKDLWRIESVIFALLYALFIVRMIMYWRIATFPPLENISKYELENTIINFDLNLGFKLPIPLTVIWMVLFVGVIALFRQWGSVIQSKYEMFIQTKVVGKRSIIKSYALLMLGLLIIFVINEKILGIEMLTRILAIIVPCVLYILFSVWSNRHFVLNQNWVKPSDATYITEIKAYLYYFINNPTFIISLITLGFFAITDRGFAVLFVLFLILKNILLNFLKKSYNSKAYSFGSMLFKPNNYWVYGILALITYLVVLSVKSLFYHVLQHYMIIAALILMLVWLCIYFFYNNSKKLLKIIAAVIGVYLLLIAIPFTRNLIDNAVNEEIKHVQYRMSIIHQPISDLMMENEYSSFSTKKIIETAENQWFINSYISKEYDNSKSLNLRPYNRVGVNYNTQTRDVVLARFVIGEMGEVTMYLILIMCVLPLIIYLISYKFTPDDDSVGSVNIKSYPGLIPLILFFTICLFVWLTSTNRFVFFGQDFPFLSLTSKTSMVLPLLLLGITLLQRPRAKQSDKVNLQSSFVRYALFLGAIVFFALVTVQPNTLSTRNFSVIVEKTQRHIDQELNAIMMTVQDSISEKKPNYAYADMITALKADARFISFMEDSLDDPYSRSIVHELVEHPYNAFKVNSPIYIQYDDYRYSALYNQHFYLELTPVENEEVWHGSITEMSEGQADEITMKYGNEYVQLKLPAYKNDLQHHLQLAIIPQSWLYESSGHLAIADVTKGSGNTSLSIYKDINQAYEQRSNSFASTIYNADLVAVDNGTDRFTISFEDNARSFAINKWINGKYRILYPQRPSNMWMYHFAHSIRTINNETGKYRERYPISLDFALNKKVESLVHTHAATAMRHQKYKFSVIAADGNGNIHLMQDYVQNRRPIDPNDNYLIHKLKQQQFFFSNIRNERDQWGEANLLNMQLGPGSSVKALIAGVVPSQVNAGWEHLILSGVMGDPATYAGFKLTKPWKKEVQDGGSFDLPTFIAKSSNFYQSVLLFLGSYPKDAFIQNNVASLSNVLSTQAGANNSFPVFSFNGQLMFLSNYNKGNNNWPVSNPNEKKRRYFGNENSLLSNGLEVNVNLLTKEKNKESLHLGAYDRINIIDSANYKILQSLGSSNYLWSMPEESSFLQSLRAPAEIHQNVNIGLKTATLGGYPYQLSPFKMLEMYGSMMTQNRAYRLHLDDREKRVVPWQVDSTWGSNARFNTFLANNIFKGMSQVISAGTGRSLNAIKAHGSGLFYYAKTGTINEEGSGASSSKRLIVAISDKDLTIPENIGKSKVFVFYFMQDRIGSSISWDLVNQVIIETMKSQRFKYYFNQSK